jgi:hypothetical protein
MPFIGERSMTMPSSQVEKPGMLWLPPRTATSSPSLRAKPIAWRTSDESAQRAITAGRASWAPFQMERASS